MSPTPEQVGFTEVTRRGTDAAKDLPADIVYAGFSLGVLPAQALAQTRPGARGALPNVRVALRVRDRVAEAVALQNSGLLFATQA